MTHSQTLREEIVQILDLHPYPSLGGQGTLLKKKRQNCKAQRYQGYQEIMTHRISYAGLVGVYRNLSDNHGDCIGLGPLQI